MKKNKGFTLIELLIVMAVIAILVSIALPSLRGMQTEARKTKAQGDIMTLQVAIEAYYSSHGNLYPAEADYQAALTSEAIAIRLLDTPLYDPFGATSTTTYSYSLSTHDPSTSLYYIVYSVGPGENGTAAVNATGQVTASNDAIWVSNGHS